MMFPIVLQDGDTFLQEPIGSDVPALPWPSPLTDTKLVRPEARRAPHRSEVVRVETPAEGRLAARP